MERTLRCLYCGKQLSVLRKLTGGGEFCSDDHRKDYQEEYNRLALSRSLQSGNLAKSRPTLPVEERLMQRASQVLGSTEEAARWFRTPIRALNNRTPLSLIGTPEGLAQIEDELGALEHGIW